MQMKRTIAFTVNGQKRSVETDPNRPLLDVLREDLGLMGCKFGCGERQCGACTVLVNGRPTFSCSTRVATANNRKIETIEGLSDGETLHPVQEAFLAEGALQCGYCTPGMIMNAVALLREKPKPTRRRNSHRRWTATCAAAARMCGSWQAVARAAEAGALMEGNSHETTFCRQATETRRSVAIRPSVPQSEIRNPQSTRRDRLRRAARAGAFQLCDRSAQLCADAGRGRAGHGDRHARVWAAARRTATWRRRFSRWAAAGALGANSLCATTARSPCSPGKVDGGQGSRGQLAQAAAEELRVPLEQDSQSCWATPALCPNDGSTAGSRTTPRTVPAVRQAAAAMRQLLVDHAAEKWGVEPDAVEVRDGKIVHAAVEPLAHLCRSGQGRSARGEVCAADAVRRTS